MEALQIPFEASFPSLLERALEGKTPRRVEVVNASVSGWGTDDELQYLTTHGMQWKPDLVVVAMTLHNDISDNLRKPQRLVTRVADQVGIPVIDLLPAFREWTTGGDATLYLERDGHWNDQGHRLGSDIVSRELVRRGLIP